MPKKEDDTFMTWTTTLLAVPPIATFFVSDILSWSFEWQGSAPAAAKLIATASQRDASARLLMLAAALATLGLVYLIVLRFIADLRDEFGPQMRKWLIGWYSAGLLLGALWVISGCMQVPADSHLGKDFSNNALHLFGGSGATGGMLLASFRTLLDGSRLALMLAAGIVVLGGVSALAEPKHPLTADEHWIFLEHQRSRLRDYVNAAAALLVVSLVFQTAWMRWLLVALDPAYAMMVARHVDAFAIFTGVTGSVVIALFAIPAAKILASRTAALPKGTNVTESSPILAPGLLSSLGKIMVILAPTLAGFVPTILDVLGHGKILSP